LHSIEKENLLKELNVEEKTLMELKDTLQILGKNYSIAFEDKLIPNQE